MNETKKELTLERAVTTVLMKYQRLFQGRQNLETEPMFYRGMEVYNMKTQERGIVSALLLNGVELVHSDGRRNQVNKYHLIPAEIYDRISGALTLVVIFYKGKGTPAVLVSEATLALACPTLIENYPYMFCIPERNLLRGKNRERFYDQMRKALVYVSWDDKTPDDIYAMNEDELDILCRDENFTIEKVLMRLLDVYKITPCETCTVPLTCDCRMRIVQQVKGDNAASYKAAQHTIRELSEPLAFWMKGIFRGRPRVRLQDYDEYLENTIDKDFTAKGVISLLSAIKSYEQWSGTLIGDEVMTTINEAAKRLGYASVDELGVNTEE